MDTMSLHMAISGLTGFQRSLWMASRLGKRKGLQEVKEHMKRTGQKKEGPMVRLRFSPYFTLLISLVVMRRCDEMFLCVDWLLGLGEHQQHQ